MDRVLFLATRATLRSDLWHFNWFAQAGLHRLPSLFGLIGGSRRGFILRPMERTRAISLFGAFVLLTIPSPAQNNSSWQMESSGTTASLRGIDSVNGAVVWASGTDGTVLKTVDGGTHWVKCAVPDASKDGATLDFRGVQAWDAQTALVMASGSGAKSRLYKTTDGCRTWALLFANPDTPAGFFDSFWLNGARGILLGDPVREQFVVFSPRTAARPGNATSTAGCRSTGARLRRLLPAIARLASEMGCLRGRS